jgi:hypothetical protein
MRAFASVKNGYVETLSTDKRAGQLLSRETGTGIPVAPNSRKAVHLCHNYQLTLHSGQLMMSPREPERSSSCRNQFIPST